MSSGDSADGDADGDVADRAGARLDALRSTPPRLLGRASAPTAASEPSEPDWTPPEEFDEYKLVRLLGKGSSGQVYLARDTVLDRPVAVKFIGNVAADAEDRERFIVEARAVARLQHPNVVTIHRVGELAGHPYLITEYVRGKSLSDLPIPQPWRKVLELGVGLARGLAAAHRHGVLHRDIKLANAVLSETGEVKLLDFSLAKLLDPSASDSSQPQPAAADAIEAATAAIARHAAELARQGGRSASQRLQGVAATGLETTVSAPAYMAIGPASLTQVGTLLGTPNYMAPELWRAEAASRRSDVYALGALMYVLASGRPPSDAETALELATRVQERDAEPLLVRAPRCDPRLASIIDRCLRRDPFERFASADDLLAALESLLPNTRELTVPEGNPYRGLQAFESQHRALFFGRGVEIRAVLERLRAEALVVVAGDSGVGKSSLVKAGVVPLIEEGQLEASRRWRSASMTPGRYPLQSLTIAMAGLFDMSEEEVGALARAGGDEFMRTVRRRVGDAHGRLLVIDQFEELATLGAPEEVAVVGPMLARLASGLSGIRVLATVRGDFLTRVAQVPGIGDELARAIYILRPLSPEGAREAIVGPARVKGVVFESDALVEGLVEAGSKGSLPLLQFALAELWETRDQQINLITTADLLKIGGVSGALARHGDAVIAALIPEQRVAARRVLMRLVTVEDTRAVRSEEELVAGSPAAAEALRALVKSRLVVAREVADQAVFEIAHEALLGGWATLSTWLEEEREVRAIRHRLELAVAEWERLGRSRDALWSGKQLQEVRGLDPATLRPKERAFIDACRAAAARLRVLRRAAAVAVPLVALLTYGGVWFKGQVDLGAKVDAQVVAAGRDLAAGERMQTEADGVREQAFAAYGAGKPELGEELWGRYVEQIPEAERALARAGQQLETALALDPRRDDVRERLVDVLLRRALLAEQTGRDALAVEDQLERLRLYDTGGAWLARWDAPARLSVRSEPAGARVVLERYVDERGRLKLGAAEELGATPTDERTLARGSYRLRFELAGRAPVVQPIMLARDEALAVDVVLPPAESVPDGFVYVPAGRFLYGADGPEAVRTTLLAEPLHSVETGAYVIGRLEVTFAQYLEFLGALSDTRRREILGAAASGTLQEGVRLTELPGGGWQLEIHQGARVYTARTGEPLVYEGRSHRARPEWENLPVTGLSFGDAEAYMAWLDRTGRVPGARFCTEHEWERAARGADGRDFAGGDRLEPTDANISTTYGRVSAAFGPDPVGSYPHTESPFGLYDTVGNAYEMTVPQHKRDTMVVRGGAFFYDAWGARAANRFEVGTVFRHSTLGLRVCATWPPPGR